MTIRSLETHSWTTTMLRAVVDNGPTALLFLSGALTGSLIVLMCGAIDVQNDATKYFLGALPALVGAALGLIAGRALDRIKDRREVSRKSRALSLQIRSLAKGWKANFEILEELTTGGTRDVPIDGACLTREQVGQILSVAERLRRTAVMLPSFSDVLESDIDAEHAENVTNLCSFTASHYPAIVSLNRSEARKIAASLSTRALYELARAAAHQLEEAERHFRGRAYV